MKYPMNDEFTRLQNGAGWDDVRAANKLALHKTVIWKYRRNKAVPSRTVLRLLSGLTGIPFTIPGEEPVRFHDGPRWLEEWESDVITTLRRVEPKARKRVIAAIREMVDAMGPPARYVRPRKSPRGKSLNLPSAADLVRHFASDIIESGGERSPAAATGEQPEPPSPM